MENIYIKGTGLQVSRVCLGTMTFGSKISHQSEVDSAVNIALQEGINFFDTADQYVDGKSEEMLGMALRKRRNQVVLASKVGFPHLHKKEFSLSRNSIISGINESLQRLQTDYIDIYYLHAPDYNTPLEESLEALNDMVRAGKVRYIGMSNYAAWQLCDAMCICKQNHWASPIVSETCYNALTRGAEQELVPFLKEKKMGMTIFNPLAGGMLTGKHKPGCPTENTRFENNPNYQKRYWREDNFKAIEQLTFIGEQNGISLIELAFRWCVSQEWVTSVITGFSDLEQLQKNIEAFKQGTLDVEILAKCDAVWASVNGGRVTYNR